jgi:hypothetical protein
MLQEQTTSKDFMWISKDTGVSFQCVPTPAKFLEVTSHPSRHGWFLATANANAADTDTPSESLYGCELQVTAELKLRCFFIADKVTQFDWSSRHNSDVVNVIVENRGFVRVETPIRDRDMEVGPVLIGRAEYFVEAEDGAFLFVVTEPSNADKFHERVLFVSTNGGISFNEAKFPLVGRHLNFAIVDATPDLAMVCVETHKTRMEGTSVLQVSNPDLVVRNISAFRAAFTDAPDFVERVGFYYNPQNPLGCDWGDYDHTKIYNKVLIVKRGECKFHIKALMAQVGGQENFPSHDKRPTCCLVSLNIARVNRRLLSCRCTPYALLRALQ